MDVNESRDKFVELNRIQPNTEEMENLFNEIKTEIERLHANNGVVIYNIDAMGGSGKSTFIKKVYHYCRSQKLITLGCSSTSLSCQVYAPIFFDTVHGLFSVPVMEDEEEYDNINNIYCDLRKNPGKVELVNAAKVIIMDEFFSLHKYVIHAILRSYNGLKGKIVVLGMDRGQTAAIVRHGNRRDIVNATILSHPIWEKFIQKTLSRNLRLTAFDNDAELAAVQSRYAKVLTQIRTNGPFNDIGPITVMDIDEASGSKLLRYEGYTYFTDPSEVIDFLYGAGFANTDLTNRAILCSTNERCDYWNEIIQDLNESEQSVTLLSAHMFYDVDDPHNVLKDMLNADTLEYYNKPGVPPHELHLKKGDICFLLRTMSKQDQLCKNVRVRIENISRFRIKVLVLGQEPVIRYIPRIRFTIRHAIGFTIIRTQFPLQLAYAMTKNKSQGQSLPWCVNDITVESFSHGQEYVALSRPQEFMHAAIFCNVTQTDNDAVMIKNVVYQELFKNGSLYNDSTFRSNQIQYDFSELEDESVMMEVENDYDLLEFANQDYSWDGDLSEFDDDSLNTEDEFDQDSLN